MGLDGLKRSLSDDAAEFNQSMLAWLNNKYAQKEFEWFVAFHAIRRCRASIMAKEAGR